MITEVGGKSGIAAVFGCLKSLFAAFQGKFLRLVFVVVGQRDLLPFIQTVPFQFGQVTCNQIGGVYRFDFFAVQTRVVIQLVFLYLLVGKCGNFLGERIVVTCFGFVNVQCGGCAFVKQSTRLFCLLGIGFFFSGMCGNRFPTQQYIEITFGHFQQQIFTRRIKTLFGSLTIKLALAVLGKFSRIKQRLT